MHDLDYVDQIQMNGLHVDYEYSRHTLRLDEFALNVECCRNFKEFLLLTKLDFPQERYMRVLYGKEFENMDWRDLVKIIYMQ